MKCIFLDPQSGIAGDMTVGALIDAGVPLDVIKNALATIDLAGYEVSAKQVSRGPFRAVKFDVRVTAEQHSHRHYPGIVELFKSSGLADGAKKYALSILEKIGRAEAAVHGTTMEKVHFHEVGAIDSIVDVAAVAVALDYLGVKKAYSGPARFGSGTVQCQHGTIPVPAPATAEILKGYPAVFTGMEGELTTPTGAGIIAALAAPGDSPPEMRILETGHGAGSREIDGLPNVLRVFVGETADESSEGEVVLIETNVDDMTGEMVGALFELLLEADALDVYATPVTMKKSRPGIILSVLAEKGDVEKLESIVFRETTTFGLRKSLMQRTCLEREKSKVATPHGEVEVKIGRYRGMVVSVQPEYDSARKTAQAAGVPLKEIYRLVQTDETFWEGNGK